HVDVFRYVAWASTGVNPKTLKSLEEQIRRESIRVSASLGELAARPDLSARERAAVVDTAGKWQRYPVALDDTIEISSNDPALGTVMLGGTDEDYGKVAHDIQAISALVTAKTRSSAQDLVGQAGFNQRFIAWVGAIATLLGLGVTLVMSRSIV